MLFYSIKAQQQVPICLLRSAENIELIAAVIRSVQIYLFFGPEEVSQILFCLLTHIFSSNNIIIVIEVRS